MPDEGLETGLIGGVEQREITIFDYDSSWPSKFERHAQIIAAGLGNVALRIEHVGSTSVPGLAAKPIIDMLVVVANSADEWAYRSGLETAGYVLRVREPAWNEHRMFRTPEKDVQVHIFSAGCQEIERLLTFRDRLRKNADDKSRYEKTKRMLAANQWPDMNAYAQAKTEVIESVIAAAQAVGEISR
jgi:GrpB-like predicted nucleotidyltransferase (UPF0157 family)